MTGKKRMRFEGTAAYVADKDLMVAVNAAIALERPLLVKGEPGTGKTELARQVASALGLLIAPPKVTRVRTLSQRLGHTAMEEVERAYTELERSALDTLSEGGVLGSRPALRRFRPGRRRIPRLVARHSHDRAYRGRFGASFSALDRRAGEAGRQARP